MNGYTVKCIKGSIPLHASNFHFNLTVMRTKINKQTFTFPLSERIKIDVIHHYNDDGTTAKTKVKTTNECFDFEGLGHLSLEQVVTRLGLNSTRN